jgi:hypothetical protein
MLMIQEAGMSGQQGNRNGSALALREVAVRTRQDRVLESHYQGLWFTLSRSRWASLAIVPADAGESSAGLATALADVGRRLRNTPVTFLVMAGSVDYASAGKFVSSVAGKGERAPHEFPTSRVIVAVPPVIIEPLALAVTDAADAIAIYVRKGSTHLDAATRTIELLGRDRIIGCVFA